MIEQAVKKYFKNKILVSYCNDMFIRFRVTVKVVACGSGKRIDLNVKMLECRRIFESGVSRINLSEKPRHWKSNRDYLQMRESVIEYLNATFSHVFSTYLYTSKYYRNICPNVRIGIKTFKYK